MVLIIIVIKMFLIKAVKKKMSN